MKILTIFFILIFLSGNEFLFTQDELNNQFQKAEKLFKEEKYFDAITEFKRVIFFDSENKYDYESYYKVALSYRAGNKLSEAIRYFSLAEQSAQTRDEILNAKFEIVKLNILRRTTSSALNLLDKIESEFPEKQNDVVNWRGWAFIFQDDWESAANEFNKIDSLKWIADFCKNIENSKYSVRFAKIISYFLPGAGQFYSGNYLSGFLSLGWTGLWTYLTVNSFVEKRIFDSVMIGNFLWLRFYNGNIQNAEKFAIAENQKISNNALEYLQNNFKGKKP